MVDNTQNRWTEAEEAIVRRMHAEGYSATEISKTLKGRSRNAVIGLIHRKGMRSSGAQAAQRVTHVQRLKATAKPPRAASEGRMSDAERWAKAGRASILAATQVARKPVTLRVVGSAAPSPEDVHDVIGGLAAVLTAPPEARELVSMLALESGMCRNPISEGPDGPLFCGRRVEDRRKASYCPECAVRLLQPSSAMRPVKALSEPAPRKRVALGAIRYGG